MALGYEVDRLKRITGALENIRLSETTEASLPAAAAAEYGRFRLVWDSGASGRLVVCVRTSGGGYEWVTVAVASS